MGLDRSAAALAGPHTREAALEKLLAGTALTSTWTGENTVVIREPLRHILMSAPAFTRIRAIALARRLAIVGEIESLLISLITQPHGPIVDERVVASAVIALGTLHIAAMRPRILPTRSSRLLSKFR